MAQQAPEQPARVRRLGGRFSGMVWLPDALRLESAPPSQGVSIFRVLNAEGRETISRGFCCLED